MIHTSSVMAQLFTTSSSSLHSYGGGGSAGIAAPTFSGSSSFMQSGSRFSTSTTISSYSTAPIHIANGTIKTVASTLEGGILSDETGFIPTTPQTNTTTTNNNGTIAPPEFAPLHFDWDALLFIFLLLIPYLYRVDKRRISGE